ncbi:DMT family transporter [Mucisphaera calidilacus]|uniref:EamA-like transporter family protein n=1 Tax=Mucisphaera calidilacus TaxID=2527982 RepID=A0A518BYW4_9BACT|nr:DMT family transporter [Mucisphaera calidilacus]QDU72158.1 EamA-like transporter family protein [Mucisphaera calidilacus]
MWWNGLLLGLGVYACSTAVILIKASEMHALWLSAGRLLLAALFLLPLWWSERAARAEPGRSPAFWRTSMLPGLFLAIHFITWIIGARLTPAANSTLIVNLVPLVSPLLLLALVGERVTWRETLGTVLALGGVVFMVWDDFGVSGDHFLGDLSCFFSMIMLAAYLVLGRKYREAIGLWSYVVPLYGFAGLICLGVAVVARAELPVLTLREAALLLGLAVVPTIVGHSLLNVAMRRMRGQIVSIANTGQCFFAGVMAWVLFGEVPTVALYVAAGCVLTGILISIAWSGSRNARA